MKEKIQNVIKFMEDYVIECPLTAGCGRCDEARRHVKALKSIDIATEVERRIAERTVKEDVLIERLVQLYYNGDWTDKKHIAKICDEALDRTGRLLGEVREKSTEVRSRLTENKQEGSSSEKPNNSQEGAMWHDIQERNRG